MLNLFKKYPLLYSENDQNKYEQYIKDNIGFYKSVFHEIYSPDLHIDIAVIEPTKEKDYYTLVTIGMGAYKMKVPVEQGRLNRAELAIRLPKDWNINSNEEKWYWPMRVLKILARMPISENTWLGLYHDADFGNYFSEDTKLCGVLLDSFDEKMNFFKLKNGDQLAVYNVLPIYREEMEYKNKTNAESLLSKMDEKTIKGPLDINRKNVV